MLSGGEKARLALAKFMLTPGTLLVLDEPTNHLDIPSKEMLEEALVNFEGAVITVSHDRYFLRKTATRIVTVSSPQEVCGLSLMWRYQRLHVGIAAHLHKRCPTLAEALFLEKVHA